MKKKNDSSSSYLCDPISDKIHISDYDLKIMVDHSKELHGNNDVEVVKGVII